jgi:F-type H+-transporting ATPase subunit b
MISVDPTVVIQLVILLTLMVILSQMAFKPFLNLLQERKGRIEGAEKRARELQQRTDQLMERYREAMATAQAQGTNLREELRKEGLAQEMEILQKAVTQANQLIEELKSRIGAETEVARAQLRAKAQMISREIAEKVLGRRLS